MCVLFLCGWADGEFVRDVHVHAWVLVCIIVCVRVCARMHVCNYMHSQFGVFVYAGDDICVSFRSCAIHGGACTQRVLLCFLLFA